MASSRYANQTETENDIPLPFHDNQSTSTTKPRSQSDMDIISISLAAIQIFCPMLQSFKKSVEIARREEYAREFLMHVRKLEALRIDLLATTEGFRCYKDCLHKLTDGSQAEAKMVRQCLEEMQTHLENCRAMITKYAPENGQSSSMWIRYNFCYELICRGKY